MNVLAIDTSGEAAGVAVLKSSMLAYESIAINRLTHSANIMPMIEEGIARAGLSIDEIDMVACVVGPGSFTGVRIGVATAKALAHAKNIPCVAVNALEAMAQIPADGIVCPILDARAGQVYGAAFKHGIRLQADTALKIELFVNELPEGNEPVWFIGSGAIAFKETIQRILAPRALFLPEHLNHLRPGAAAYVGIKDIDKAVDYMVLKPLYLRAPQAERERARKEVQIG